MVIPLAEAAAAAFRAPGPDRSARRARSGTACGCPRPAPAPGRSAAFGPDGTLVALLTEHGGQARSLVVFPPDPPAGS